MKLTVRTVAVTLSTLALAVSGIVAVSASGASAAAKKVPTYALGFEGPLSGGDAALGIFGIDGARLAVDQWNVKKGIPFKIKLVPGDSQGDPTIAPSVATGFVLNPQIVAVVGPMFSGETVATLSIYGANHMAEVSPSATRVSITVADPTASPTGPYNTYHNFFRVIANDGVQGPADGNYLYKNYGSKGTILVISDTSTYGAGLATQAADAIKAAGGTLANGGSILNLPYSNACTVGGTGTSDAVTASLTGVSAVFYGGYYCDFAQVIDNLVGTQHFTGAIMSGDGSDDPGLVKSLSNPADGNGVLVSCACSAAFPPAWAAQYTALNHSAPGTYSSESFDATNVIIQAMLKVKGSMTRSKVLAQIPKTHWVGISKTITFNKAGDVAGTAIYVSKIENGVLTQLGQE